MKKIIYYIGLDVHKETIAVRPFRAHERSSHFPGARNSFRPGFPVLVPRVSNPPRALSLPPLAFSLQPFPLSGLRFQLFRFPRLSLSALNVECFGCPPSPVP